MSKKIYISEDKLTRLMEGMAVDESKRHAKHSYAVNEASPEVDEYEIGQESNNPPVGGNYCHVNEDDNPQEHSFENWFGDSILKDEDGNPMKMYHGTDADFNAFSKDFIGKTGSFEGYGFNFTPFQSRAASYNSKRVIEAYLKVTNPMTSKDYKISLRDLMEIIRELDSDKPYTDTVVAAYEPPRYGEKWDERYYRRALPLAAKAIYDYNKESDYGDAGLYAEICINGNADTNKTIDIFERLGYDSAIFYDDMDRINTVIVFEPNQIKLTSNKTYNSNSDVMGENMDLEVDASDIDLSSFKKKDELVPSIWEDDVLNSRVRLKLLDIADDFWDFVNLTWVEPISVILTGSICNFNWSKYSDIDLHLIVDFNEIDEKTEFVKAYLDAKKNEWNNEHENLEIMGYKVELYVQNVDEMPESSGIYDLEKDEWIRKPNQNDIKPIGLEKFSIKTKAAKIMTIIDDMYDALSSAHDSVEIETIGEDAKYLWQKVKEMRRSGLEKDGESSSGNICYKYMRRMGYLDKLWKLRAIAYDKTNSIHEERKQYNVFLDGKKDTTFSSMKWKRKPKVGKGFYYGGAVFKVDRIDGDDVYVIEESKEPLMEYLDKNYNLPLYKYFKWASNASAEEKAQDLAYIFPYKIEDFMKDLSFDGVTIKEFDELLDDEGNLDTDNENNIELSLKIMAKYHLCDNFIDYIRCNTMYYDQPTWMNTDFSRMVKNEWCIHFGNDAMNIANEGFTGGTDDINQLAYTNARQKKNSEGYDFAFIISDLSVDDNEYGSEAVIFRTSGVEIYHWGDNQRQVIFWGPYAHDFIPISYSEEEGEWIVTGMNNQILKAGKPSEIAMWATNNLPQYRKQIMAGKNGYTPMRSYYDSNAHKVVREPYPIFKNESIRKYISLLKNNAINEEWVADGNANHNPYKKRWDAERKALKDFICNYGKVMQSKENGKLYKVYYDQTLSQLVGYNYVICLQWDAVELKPKSVLYIRALDKFSPNIKQVPYDTRGKDNVQGTYDDLRYGNT